MVTKFLKKIVPVITKHKTVAKKGGYFLKYNAIK